MLEIVALFTLCRRIGILARAKGYRAVKYQALLVIFWFVGELATAFVAGFLLIVVFGDQYETYLLYAYGSALAGACGGAWVVFGIVASLPERRASGAA